jgi:hypothetical protein
MNMSKEKTTPKKRKTDSERAMAYKSLPPAIRENFTDEEKELFLHGEEWPEELFQKLEEFIVKE